MTLAPNENNQSYARKLELQGKKDKTLEELYELKELCAIAISHLVVSTAR